MEIRFIPFKGQFIIYRPLLKLAFVGNQALVDYLQARINRETIPWNDELEAFLKRVGFWSNETLVEPPAVDDYPQPTMAVLLLTNQCNLKCCYCYAAAGERSPEVMAWPTARAVIDAACNNAEALEQEGFSLSFHGGGEPTVSWRLLTQAVEYARGKRSTCTVSLTSNGIWNEGQRRYICEHFDQVSLSMDGIAHVQNLQRPLADGRPSFPVVMESMAALDEAGVSYGVRMTALPNTISSLCESVEFICTNSRAGVIQIEPTYTSARGVYSDAGELFAAEFVSKMSAAMQVGREHGVFVYYSAARPWVNSAIFCGAPLQALIAMPDGKLITCFEVTSAELAHAPNFIIGEVKDASVHRDEAALQRFLDVQEERRSGCRACFCYWHCCGDCATRSLTGTGAESMRCTINKGLTIEVLANLIADGNGVWCGGGYAKVVTESEAGCE